MQPKEILMEPFPITTILTKWEEWREVIIFMGIVFISSIIFYHLTFIQPVVPIILFAIGVFLDFSSICARILTYVTGRYSSGFFLIGFVFYFWTWLSYPNSILISTNTESLLSIWLYKSLDIFVMAIFHLFSHLRFGKDKDTEEKEKKSNEVISQDAHFSIV